MTEEEWFATNRQAVEDAIEACGGLGSVSGERNLRYGPDRPIRPLLN